MKKNLLLTLALLMSLCTFADSVEINGIYYVLDDSNKTAEVTSNPNKYNGNIVIPHTIEYNGNNYDVTTVGYCAFLGCKELSSVVIPNGVTSIGERVFESCYNLESVILPNGITDISKDMFKDCYELKSIDLPSTIVNIWTGAFWNCKKMESIFIPKSVEHIDLAMWGCADPYDMRNPFAGCGLTSIKVDDDNSVYDTHGDCNAIFEKNRNNLLIGCKNTIFPEDLEFIGGEAFAWCQGLTSMEFPISLKGIMPCAFIGSSVKSIKIPGKESWIDKAVFLGCVNLETVAVECCYLGYNAFEDCEKLSTVITGESLYFIGTDAFSYCTRIKDFYCYAKEMITPDYFMFVHKKINGSTLHVPANLVNSYRYNSWQWPFANVVALTDDDPTVTGMEKTMLNHTDLEQIYDIRGNRIPEYRKGLNIVKMSDGTTKKVIK